MSARSVGLGSMFGWVPATFRLLKRDFGAMSVASLVNLVVFALMMLPMFYLMFKAISSGMGAGPMADPSQPFGASMGTVMGMYAVMLVLGMVLMPPLLAGWFQLCAAADRGSAVSGTDILRPYSNFPLWLRLLGFVALGFALYLLVFAVLGLAFRGAFSELLAMQAAQNAALATGQPPPPPSMAAISSILLMYAVMLPAMFLLQFVYMTGLAEVSLRPTPVLVAFKDACMSVLRNSLKLLLFVFVLTVVGVMVMFAVGLVVALVLVAAAFISQALSMVLMVLLYIPLLLVLYPLMFAGHYQAWKDLLDGDAPAPADDSGIVAA